MRKVLAFLVAMVLMCSLAFAADFERLGGYTALLSNTTFNNITTAINTSGYVTLGNEKTAFFVDYVETLANQSLTIVPQISQDGTVWQNITFYDIAGTTTLQTSEEITANSTYYFWLPDAAVAPYTRINMIALNTTATSTMSVQSYIVGSINPGNR